MQRGLPAPGDTVWIRQERWRVERARRDHRVVRLDVVNRERRATFLAPFDRPSPPERAGRLRKVRPQEAFARLAHLISGTHGPRTIVSAVRARAAILPHQLEPALALAAGVRRILIADEVGLGKTIQAALCIAEVIRRDVAGRVLVVVPASLRDQWIAELRGRFDIECLVADRQGLDGVARASARGDNPWARAGVWMTSLDYLKQPHVAPGLPLRLWDLVVIDEAHLACGDSARHDAAHHVASRSRRVVLLTATPHDGDVDRFRRLQGLGMLDGLPDESTVFRRTRADISIAPRRPARWLVVSLSAAETRLFDALGEFERVAIAAAGAGFQDAARLLLSVLHKRALSTAAALLVSLERRLAWLTREGAADPPEWQPGFDFEHDDRVTHEDTQALSAEIGLPASQERSWLKRLIEAAMAARRSESKIARLARLFERTREPVAVFTEYRDSLDAVVSRLRHVRPCAVLHGGQLPHERRIALDRFLRGEASALVATDVAGIGLNLQERARWVVSLELPWNPARLEQRAGRVDRIGQARPVHVTVVVSKHSAEQRLLDRLLARAGTARREIDDALFAGAVPDPASLNQWSLAGASGRTANESPPALAVCSRWRRPARRHAVDLEHQRRLSSRWQSRWPDSSAPQWTSLPRASLAARTLGPSSLVFDAAFIDAAGLVVARTVVAVRLHRALPGAGVGLREVAGSGDPALRKPDGMEGRVFRPGRQVIDAARARAVRSVMPRARAIDRWLTRRRIEALGREAAMIRAGDASMPRAEAQPGLFDDRERRAFEDRLRARSDHHAEAAGRIAALERTAAPADVRVTLAIAFVASR